MTTTTRSWDPLPKHIMKFCWCLEGLLASVLMALFGQTEWFFEKNIDYLDTSIVGWGLDCQLCFPPIALPHVISL